MKTLLAFTGLVAIIQLSQACPMIYSPVCGTDGNTYPNECFMNAEAHKQNKKITVAKRGKCGSSKCQQEALEATQSHLLGRFTPRCNPDGTYQLVQCHASTAYCWCSSPDGTKYPGTDVRFKEPNCDKYKAVPKLAAFLALPGAAIKPTLTKCQQEAGLSTRSSRALVGRFTPKCNEDGTYQLVQCHGSTGYCWCTAPDGVKYPGTDVPPGKEINCDKYKAAIGLSKCQQEVLEATQSHLIGRFRPQCNEDGTYTLVQCHASTGYCWCSASDGTKYPGTDVPPGKEINCDKYKATIGLSKCQQEVLEATQSHLIGRFRPQCNEDGTYKLVQCHASTGYCWCSASDGTKYPGTDVPPGKKINCDQYKDDKCKNVKCPSPYAQCRVVSGKAECHCRLACPLIYFPVCGTDGKTYSNACVMKAQACQQNKMITVARMGKCEVDPCKNVQCPRPNAKCHVINDKPQCQCQKFCTMEYAPVCGSDGKTYGNLCMMTSQACIQNKRITMARKGECEGPCIKAMKKALGPIILVRGEPVPIHPNPYIPTCDQDGLFTPKQCNKTSGECWCVDKRGKELHNTRKQNGKVTCEVNPCKNVQCSRPYAKCHVINDQPNCQCQKICTMEYAPVCGSDGKTYGNLCMMTSHACRLNKTITMARNGECEENECKNVDCSSRPYSQCHVVSGKPQCQCQLACTREYFPVCGSDGKTYGNLCTLKVHACEKNQMITVTKTGECDKKHAPESLVEANYQAKESKNSQTSSSGPSGSTTTIVVLSVCAALCVMAIVGVVIIRRRRGKASHDKLQDSSYTTIGEKQPLVNA